MPRSAKCTSQGTQGHANIPEIETFLGKSSFQNLLNASPLSLQRFYLRPARRLAEREGPLPRAQRQLAQVHQVHPRGVRGARGGGLGRGPLGWGTTKRTPPRRGWVTGPLRSPSASSRSPARAAGCPRAPPRNPPAPAGSGSSSAPPPASCSPPSLGAAAGGLRLERWLLRPGR